MESVRAHFYIKGLVQGVSYRAWTQNTAQKVGLTGWVRNLEDGRIEAIIEGDRDRARELIKLIKKGPKLAKVEHIDVCWEEATGEFDSFEILR